MVGTEILELRAVLEHMLDRRKQRGGNRADCLLRTAATTEVKKLCMEIAALLAPSRPGALDQQGFEPGRPFSQPGGSAFAAAFVVART